MKYYKHKIYECGDCGVSAPIQTLNNTNGIGNPVPAQIAASTAADMTNPKCIGSGDKFGFSENKKKRKPKYKRKGKKINEGFNDILDSSVIDYSLEFKKQDIWLKNTKPIKAWLDKYGVKNYTINKDYTIDVDGNVDLSDKNLEKIEVQFNNVNGDFDCSNNQLISLEGCPKEVNGSFFCNYNKLTSLEGGPEIVYDYYYADNNKLSNLEGMPKEIRASKHSTVLPFLSLKGNNKLSSAEGLINVDYDIRYPRIFYKNNKDVHPKNYISEEEANEIKEKLSGYYSTFKFNPDSNTILIDNWIRISKTPKSNYHLAYRWMLNSSNPRGDGFDGENWGVDEMVKAFIKRKEKGSF